MHGSSKRLVAAAALAAVMGLGVTTSEVLAQAQEQQQDVSVPTPPPGDEATGRRPLMSLLDRAGVAEPLDRLGINIYGHIEAGYTYNFDDPEDEINEFRIFDFEHNEPILDQVDLTIERTVDYRQPRWDAGFRIEWLYGADAGILHSNGLFDWYDSPRDPENQFDLLQAYADVVVPVGSGLRVRAGKFVNFVGYETVNPTVGGIVDFYSRSLTFFNYPFTHTGILGTYDIVEDVSLTAGISRGDNQSLEDNNDAISFLGSINWVLSEQWALYLSNSTGPERDDNEDDLRSTWDLTAYYMPREDLRFAGSVYYVFEEGGAADGDDAQLIALAALAGYDLNDYVTIKGRLEWMHDADGYRLGPVEDLYEATAGLTIRPFPRHNLGQNLKLRPEVRWDYSPEDPFDGDDSQFTAGIDAVFTY